MNCGIEKYIKPSGQHMAIFSHLPAWGDGISDRYRTLAEFLWVRIPDEKFNSIHGAARIKHPSEILSQGTWSRTNKQKASDKHSTHQRGWAAIQLSQSQGQFPSPSTRQSRGKAVCQQAGALTKEKPSVPL